MITNNIRIQYQDRLYAYLRVLQCPLYVAAGVGILAWHRVGVTFERKWETCVSGSSPLLCPRDKAPCRCHTRKNHIFFYRNNKRLGITVEDTSRFAGIT